MKDLITFSHLLDFFDEEKLTFLLPPSYQTKTNTFNKTNCIQKCFEIQTDKGFTLIFYVEFIDVQNNPLYDKELDFVIFSVFSVHNYSISTIATVDFTYTFLPEFLDDVRPFFDEILSITTKLKKEVQKYKPVIFYVGEGISDSIEETLSLSPLQKEEAKENVERFATKISKNLSKAMREHFEQKEKETKPSLH